MEITPIISEDFLVFDDATTLSQMLGKMKTFEKRSGLIFRNNKYLGLVEKKKLLRTNIDAAKTKVGKLVARTPILSEHADMIETAYLMFQSNVDFLPVEKNKQLLGVVTGLEVAKLASKLPEAEALKVDDIRLVKKAKVNKDHPVAKVINLMHDEHIDHVTVFDKGKLYGIISYRDLLRKYLNWSPRRNVSARFNQMASSRAAMPQVSALGSLPVSNFSTNDNLVMVEEDASLKNALQLMYKYNIHDLLVMRDEKFLGLLTVKNILRRLGSLKIQKNYNIKFIGLNKVGLQPHQKYNVKKIAANEAFKLQRKIHNQFSLTMHIKEYEREGRQHKYSVNLRVEFPSQILTSSQEDWEIETAVRKTFNNAKNKLRGKFKGR